MSTDNVVFGADLVPIDDATARCYLDWVLGLAGQEPDEIRDARWAVIQCELSLVWAIRSGNQWRLASDANPWVARAEPSAVREVRIFGGETEALIWRSETGLAGRFLRDAPGKIEDVCKPVDHYAAFVAWDDQSQPDPDGSLFVVWTRPNGRVVVTPDGCKVKVRQYLSEDNGVLRIAASRFVEVR